MTACPSEAEPPVHVVTAVWLLRCRSSRPSWRFPGEDRASESLSNLCPNPDPCNRSQPMRPSRTKFGDKHDCKREIPPACGLGAPGEKKNFTKAHGAARHREGHRALQRRGGGRAPPAGYAR